MPQLTDEMIPSAWKVSRDSRALEDPLKCLDRLQIKASDYLLKGSTCIVFNYGKDEIVKICTRKIDYLHYFKPKALTEFQDTINRKFDGFLLPINKILYEDSNYFIYSQDKIKILDYSQVDSLVYVKVLDILKKMLAEKMVTPDLISSNFGFQLINPSREASRKSLPTGSALVLLDYHDLKTIDAHNRSGRWNKIVHCLVILTSYLLYKESFEKHFKQSDSILKSAPDIIKRNYGAEFFPPHFVQMFKAISTGDATAIQKAITLCQLKIAGYV